MSPSRADSIVYILGRDGSLWTARPDGSHARKLGDRGFGWPSQASTGTIVAQGPGRRAPDGTQGGDIWVFAATGKLDHRIPAPADFSTLACPTFVPQHIRISPDGSKIAYDTWMCNHFITLWTPTASRGLNWPNQKLGQQGTIVPSWLGNGQVLLSFVSRAVGAREFAIYRPGDGDNSSTGWFSDAGWASGWRAFASSDAKRIAVVEDDAADRLGTPTRVAIKLYATDGAGSTPTAICATNIPFGPGFANVSPSFSPNDEKLLFGEPDGIHVAAIGDRPDCSAIERAPLVLPGATEGFWSPFG